MKSRFTRIEVRTSTLPCRLPSESNSNGKCSLCGASISLAGSTTQPQDETLSSAQNAHGRLYCSQCWLQTYSLCLCWSCGEPVVRDEEKVGYGWCWWHWGCLSCLLCKVRKTLMMMLWTAFAHLLLGTYDAAAVD